MKIARKSINWDLSNTVSKSIAQKLITMILDDILSWIIMKIWHLKIYMSDNAAINLKCKGYKSRKVENQQPKLNLKRRTKNLQKRMMKTSMRTQINEMDSCSTIENKIKLKR